ncbi:MAG TPA: CHASE3 domain-containing protein [Acetobacteraceae bacterium]|nr:CHASE3 domain-containing protein [Acetobacteraceae bacterium]
MVRERSARRAQLIGLVAALLLTAAVGVEAWVQSRAARDAMLWVRHTDEVLHTVKDLDAALASAEAEQRGFLLTGDDQQLGAYQEAVARVVPLQSRLRLLTPDNPAQQDRLRALSPLVQQRLAELAGAIAARRDRGLEAAMRLLSVESGRQLAAAIDSILSSFTEEEQRLLGDRLSNADRFSHRAFWLAASGFAAGIVLLGLSFALLGRASRRRLASEAAYRDLATQSQTVLDSISHGVAVIDAAGRLVRWNECLPIVLGLPDHLMHAGTPYSALADHLASTLMRGALFLERWEEIPHSLPERRPVVYARTCPDGRSFEVRRDSMRDGGFVLTVSDITERAGAEARLRAAQRMQAVGQLSGGIAHDFNNLLAVILGNLELALARLEAEHPVRSRLDRAIWAAKRGASLTHQLLAFARRQPLVPKPTDLASLLQEMADLLRRTLGEQIALEVVTGTDVWPAMADAAQVESAVLNLALNARDAMPQGGCLSIEVANAVVDRPSAAQPDIAPGEYVTIAVSDTGTGMSPDIMARAFEPFFTTKGSGKGTGLGLAMVFGFAKQSGGHAQIDSTPGQGTTVRIFLPRATPGTAAPEDSDTGGKAVPGGSARVLIVEDEAEVRDILAAILEDLGYSVLTAPDGAAALKVVAAQSVDLALIDVVLPGGMAGREVARRIAEKDPKVRTLFMSGYSEGEGQDNTPGAMIASIAKPFDRERLARLVAQALGTATRP